MPITTFLHDGELNQPTGDREIDELLAEVRRNTGRNYQVVTRRAVERFGLFGLRKHLLTRMSVYLEVGGMGPWQWISCTQDAATVRAYLLGMLGGHDYCLRSNTRIKPTREAGSA